VLALTVNGTVLLVPPVEVTETLYEPAAVPVAMVSVAVIWVALTTVTPLAVTPEPLTPTVVPATKLEPVKVTLTAEPGMPLFGETELSVGGVEPAFTVNPTALLVPPVVLTVTLSAPVVAPAATVKVAVICVALTRVTLLAATPDPTIEMDAPDTKFVPVRVTLTAEPCVPLFGVRAVKVGAAVLTVKGTVLLVPFVVVTDKL